MQSKTVIHIKIKNVKAKVCLRSIQKYILLNSAYVDVVIKFMGESQTHFITVRVS